MNPMILALILFGAMYALLLIFSEHRWITALAAAAVFMLVQLLPPLAALKAINWNVLMMLAGTMATVELFIQSQMPARMAEKLLQIVPNIQWAAVVLSVFSGVISAFVDNIPYVATMLPVLAAVTTSLGIEPYLMYFGLLTGATLGGNITPVGASANITAVGLLEKEGYQVSFGDFMRIGVPYTLTAVLVGYLYLWFVWA